MGVVDGRCANCAYWIQREPDEVAMLAPKQAGWGYCELTKMVDYPEGRTKAVALDGEDYWAMLHTAPDFGCVQFSERSDSAG